MSEQPIPSYDEIIDTCAGRIAATHGTYRLHEIRDAITDAVTSALRVQAAAYPHVSLVTHEAAVREQVMRAERAEAAFAAEQKAHIETRDAEHTRFLLADTLAQHLVRAEAFRQQHAEDVMLLTKSTRVLNRAADEISDARALRIALRALPRYTCDCIPNDPTNTRIATDDEVQRGDSRHTERAIVLADDLDRIMEAK